MFTRLEKTRNWVIVFFAALLVIGMAVAGVYNQSPSALANPFKSRDVLARVDGDEVTVADFTLRQRMYEQRMGGQFSLAQLGMTGERVLDTLVNDRIIGQETDRLDLTASEEEVRDVIRRQFSDASNAFDLKRYKDYVVRNFGGVELYERSIRDGIAAEKLRAFVTAGVQVSEQEVQDEYVRDSTEFDLVYVPVTATDLAKKINASDEELRQYYEAHKTDYRFLEPQKKLRYLFVNQEKAGAKLSIPEEDLRKEYDSLRPEAKQAGVRVQQIVLKVARPELDQEVLKRATDLVARVRGEDMTATEEAFAELARGNSEDPATAKNGGWLPAPVRKNPAKPNDILQPLLDMRPGEVRDAVKTGNAYYIFRRGEAVPKSFEEAKNELLVSLRNRRSYAVAQQVAQKAVERLKETKDFQKVAQELAPEANMTPAEMVKETPFVKPGDDVPDIGSNPQFEEAVKPLEEVGQLGERVGIRGGFAVPMLVEKRDPRIPEFEEVRERVAEAFRNERATQQLEQTARELAANSASPDALKAAAERLGLKAVTEEAFRVGRPLGTLGADLALDDAIYALKSGEVTKNPLKVGESWVVAAATARRDADLAEFGKQRAELIERAETERRSQVFDEYIAAIRRRLEEAGKVTIDREMLARVDNVGEPPTALPRPQRPPINLPVQPGG
ncbi:MAG TPA: peptidyl-prolyl cis-trans isomerase [Pyrinomonadaceae bacterium]|nr:peptidyl-prolyl cis-trans isomerase [Pyrinomonadaceae bacterium]